MFVFLPPRTDQILLLSKYVRTSPSGVAVAVNQTEFSTES